MILSETDALYKITFCIYPRYCNPKTIQEQTRAPPTLPYDVFKWHAIKRKASSEEEADEASNKRAKTTISKNDSDKSLNRRNNVSNGATFK